MTVNELIERLQLLTDPEDGDYGNAEVLILVGPNDVRSIEDGDDSVDECFASNIAGSVWIKARVGSAVSGSRFRELMDGLKDDQQACDH